MKTYFTIFIIIIAVIIAVTRVILSLMEDRDRAKGMMTDPKEYSISGLLKIMVKDWWNNVKAWFTNRGKKDGKKEKKQKK